jgi:hypothetical protein
MGQCLTDQLAHLRLIGSLFGFREDCGRFGSRINEFFNTKAFVPAPFLPDGGPIDDKYPVSGGGTLFGNLEGIS